MAEESILADYDKILETMPEGPRKEDVRRSRLQLYESIELQKISSTPYYLGESQREGYEHSRALEAIERLQRTEQQTIINNPMYFNPIAGSKKDLGIGDRTDRNW